MRLAARLRRDEHAFQLSLAIDAEDQCAAARCDAVAARDHEANVGRRELRHVDEVVALRRIERGVIGVRLAQQGVHLGLVGRLRRDGDLRLRPDRRGSSGRLRALGRLGAGGRIIRRLRRLAELLPLGHLLVAEEALADAVGGLERAGRHGHGGVGVVVQVVLERIGRRVERVRHPQLAQRLVLDALGHASLEKARVVGLGVERVEIDVGEIGLGQLALLLRPGRGLDVAALGPGIERGDLGLLGRRGLVARLGTFARLDLAPRPALEERLLAHSSPSGRPRRWRSTSMGSWPNLCSSAR